MGSRLRRCILHPNLVACAASTLVRRHQQASRPLVSCPPRTRSQKCDAECPFHILVRWVEKQRLWPDPFGPGRAVKPANVTGVSLRNLLAGCLFHLHSEFSSQTLEGCMVCTVMRAQPEEGVRMMSMDRIQLQAGVTGRIPYNIVAG